MARERTTGFYFNASPREMEMIKKRMAQCQCRNLRKMCIDGYVLNIDIKEINEIGRLMRITSGNINQIAKNTNSGGEAYREDIAEVAGLFNEIRMYFGQMLTIYNTAIKHGRYVPGNTPCSRSEIFMSSMSG